MSGDSDEQPDAPAPAPPLLRIVSGNASDEDVAVLTAVMSALGGGEDEPTTRRRGRWNDPAMLVRRPLMPGPGAWTSAVR